MTSASGSHRRPGGRGGLIGAVAGLTLGLLAGTALLAVGITGLVSTSRLEADGLSATGTVVAVDDAVRCEDEERDGRTERRCITVYRPTVEFTAADGRRVRFVSPVATDDLNLDLGSTVPVRYSPDDPGAARIWDPADDRTFGWVFVGAGAGALLLTVGVGLALWYVFRRLAGRREISDRPATGRGSG